MPETLSRGERLVQLAALRKLIATGTEASARQAVELARSFGDAPLLDALSEGVSLNRDGILVMEKTSEVHRRLKADVRNAVALQLVASAGKMKGVRQLSWNVEGQGDLGDLWSATDVEALYISGGPELEDLSVLPSLSRLRKLCLRLSCPANFEPLGRCRVLAHLELQVPEKAVKAGAALDLAVLAPLPQLEHLEVSGLPVRGLGHLADFRALRRLNVVTVPGA